VVARDISERKEVERIQSIERSIMKIVASAQTVAEGTAEVARFLCDEFNWELGAFWPVDENAGLLRFGSFYPGRFGERVSWIREQTFAKGAGFMGQAWERRQPVWSHDLTSDAIFGRAGAPVPQELKSGVAFPVLNQRQVVGVLTFLGVDSGPAGTSRSAKAGEVTLDENLLNLFDVLLQQIGHFVWRKLVETELQTAQKALSERERLTVVSQLAAGVAHEVKNPLAIILQGTDFLKNSMKEQDAQALGVLNGVTNAVQRADKIIHGLLELSQPEPLSLQMEDIHSVLETSLLLVKNAIDRKSIHVRKQWQPELPKVSIDKGKMEQVFINLFMNAADAMEPGGILTLRTQWTDHAAGGEGPLSPGGGGQGQVIVTVENTGPGIPESMLPKIFSPFVTSKRAQGGSGLGLPIARNIMEMHKGTIQLENIASGVKATVEFPCLSGKNNGGTQ
jgi:signal transduction histidine kinase